MEEESLVIIGAGGHGRIAAEIAELSENYHKILFLDDDPLLANVGNFCVTGTSERIEEYIGGCKFFVAIGTACLREKMQKRILNLGGEIATLIHPNAVIAHDIKIGTGCIFMAGSIVNPGARIGDGVIVNTASSVDHDCCLGNFVHIAVGAHLAGGVKVGDHTWIGAGAIISNQVTICAHGVIGAGAVVVRDVTDSGTYVGVPAKRIK